MLLCYNLLLGFCWCYSEILEATCGLKAGGKGRALSLLYFVKYTGEAKAWNLNASTVTAVLVGRY